MFILLLALCAVTTHAQLPINVAGYNTQAMAPGPSAVGQVAQGASTVASAALL